MKVAVGILIDAQDRVLLTQRPLHTSYGGYWEFPGGKLEVNESAEVALARELKEELGLEVLSYQLLGEVEYQYPDKFVHLIFFTVTAWIGEPLCLEGQLNMKWVEKHALNPQEFPEANRKVFNML